MTGEYKRPGQKNNTSMPFETTQRNSKKTRLINARIPLQLDLDWRAAVAKSNRTQTEILLSLITSFIKFSNHDNREIDYQINALMEKRERNDRNVISQSLDDAIRNLQLQASQEDTDY